MKTKCVIAMYREKGGELVSEPFNRSPEEARRSLLDCLETKSAVSFPFKDERGVGYAVIPYEIASTCVFTVHEVSAADNSTNNQGKDQ